MRIKNYTLTILFAISSLVMYGQDTIRASSRLYISGSIGFVTPESSFGSNPGFYDNNTNNFGGDGYAEIGMGANMALTYLSDGIPFGLTSSLSYYYDKVDVDSYVAQVNTFALNHFGAIHGTGYQQITLLGGITISASGKDSWIDFKLMGGVMVCFTPLVEDSGSIGYYVGTLQPQGKVTVEPANTIVPAWEVGVEARPAITKKTLFLFSASLLVALPIINTTQQTGYFDYHTYSNITESAPYQYKLNLTSIYISAGIAFKL